LYEGLYCARGQAENHIKAWKNHLATDRTSCHQAEANQFRLFLHAGAYWLLWSMRRLMPKRSIWRVMQFDTLRLRLIKLAARVIELKTRSRSTCRRAPPIKRSSPCSWIVCRVSLPESRGLMPPQFLPSLQPHAPTRCRTANPATAASITFAQPASLQSNASSSIGALLRYCARASIGLVTARIRAPSENPEVVKEMDYEARELAELSADD
jgi:hypothetical protein